MAVLQDKSDKVTVAQNGSEFPDLADSQASGGSNAHEHVPNVILNQTSIKKLFSFTQIFFFALTFMSSWETMALNLNAVITNGGPQALAWGIVIVIAGALSQSASLAELASMQPIAGAQYHWTHYLAPARHRKFITWIQGWITWFAWVTLLAGVANTTATMIQGLAIANYPSYVPHQWHITLIIFGMLIVESFMTMFTFWLVPWLELLAGILHIVLFLIFVVVLVAMAPRHSAHFVFLGSESASGWNDSYVSWNIGLLTPVWGFVGFDGAVHMSEEVRKARHAVPRSMVLTVAMNGILAYGIIVTILFTMGSIENALKAPFPIIEICQQATGSVRAATAMVCFLLVISLSVNLASIASVSRLTWAWARDGALPSWFAYIDAKRKVPVRAVCLPVFLVIILACLNIGSTAAFGAFISLSSISLFASYIIAIGCMVGARFSKEGVELGEWNMGRLGLPVNVFAIIYSLYVAVFLAFPSYRPVTAQNMNYAAPIFGAAVLFTLLSWLVWARTHWRGLNKDVIRLVVEDGKLNLKL